MQTAIVLGLTTMLCSSIPCQASEVNVMDYGVTPDPNVDVTAGIQEALNGEGRSKLCDDLTQCKLEPRKQIRIVKIV